MDECGLYHGPGGCSDPACNVRQESGAETVARFAADFMERRLFQDPKDARLMAHIVVVHGVDEREVLSKDVAAWRDMHDLQHRERPVGLGHRHLT